MKVASPSFRPRSAERPRRNGGLLSARTHNRLEPEPVAADSDAPRFSIVNRRDGGPRGESILLSPGRTIQAAISLIADGRQQIQIRKVSAVLDNKGIGSIVAEAMRCDIHLEAELQRVARLERLLQRINAIAEIVVQQRQRRWAVNRDRSGLDSREGGQMDGVDRHATGVREDVSAANLHLSFVWIDLDAKARTRQLRLRDACVLSVAPLVLGAPRHLLQSGTVLINHVGVIEDEPSERENEAQRRGRSPHREARQATVCHSQPYTKARFPASRPEQHRHHGEQYCPRRPVELEPQPWCERRSEATNVRVEPALLS